MSQIAIFVVGVNVKNKKKGYANIKEMWKIGDDNGNYEYFEREELAKKKLYERIKTDFGDSVEFQVLKDDVIAVLNEFSDVFFIAKVIVSR